MNVAILGNVSFLRRLTTEYAESRNHRVVYSQRAWEQFDLGALRDLSVDTLVLGGSEDDTCLLRVIESIKAFEGTSLLIHPLTNAVFTAYEVERLAGDAVGKIVPLLPLFCSPMVRALQQAIAGLEENIFSELGQIERVEMERAFATDAEQNVFETFTQDATLLSVATGPMNEIVAMRLGDEPVPLNVQCASRSGGLVRWSALRSFQDDAAAHLLIEGSAGRCELRLNASEQWTVKTASGEQTFPAGNLMAQCAAAADSPADWRTVTHSLEVREAAEKSMKRGRLVRLNLDGRGERTAFKGTMASLGCGLLLGGLFLMIISAFILSFSDAAGLGKFTQWISKLPWVLAGLMLLFLMIQLLALVIPRGGED
ncbi:MAG: hypothetical protein P8K78_09510 [Pirellulales bacterium]|nr:hypothetical protein [Pirellulales bacterium]